VGDYRAGSVPVGLATATDVDSVAWAALSELLALPDVRRAGVALVEGGGRRLRFVSAQDAAAWTEWCHIDAYDDVPLTSVVRTGIVVLGDLDSLGGRYAALVENERLAGTRALAVFPLAGGTLPIGGLIAYYDREQGFDAAQCGILDALAQHVADAVRRVRPRGVAAAPADAAVSDADSSARRASRTLEDDPQAAGIARRFLRETLAEWEVEDDPVDTAELCLSELVTNAVIHAGATSELTLTLDAGLLTVAVRDHGGSGGPDAQVVEDEDPMRVFGRGLVLVDALSDSWGSARDAVGTTSWFVVDALSEARSAVS
jgi:anti-sigma regulatory factor (Ser/Thr protein kinase)